MEIWEDIAKRKKEEQWERIPVDWRLPQSSLPTGATTNVLDIPQTCGILSAKEVHITEFHDATSLLDELRGGRLKSVDVVTAFCKRAAIAHQLTNCLTEIFFEQSIESAKHCDDYLKKYGRPIGPLHGLPVSLKDTFKIPGLDATIGFASHVFKPSKEPSNLVTLLIQAGAVLYCKTNVPQTLMALDSHNNVFGRVLNPRNLKLTAGGSSGGEGALLAMRGSILGVGTDVGGSIRIPAMCHGLYGVKPSWQRIPYGGQQGSGAEGSPYLALPASAGPIAHSARDCKLLLRSVADAQPWNVDADVAYGLWSEQGSARTKKDLVIGIVRRDGVIDPLPPVQKIINETAAALQAQGIKVVNLDITPLFKQCQSIANILFGVDGNNYVFDVLESTGEPLSPWLKTRLRRKPAISVEKLREAHARREQLRSQFLKIWRDEKTGAEMDALICPVAPHPTPPIDRWNGVSYTSSFVLLDYPAGTIPVRELNAADLQGDLPPYPPLGPWDKANRELWTDIDRSEYLGTTLCVQVVAPKLQERRLLNAMSIIDGALKAKLGRATTKSRL